MKYNDYPLRSYDKIRFRDTDKQGHVNNAVFSTYLETGRTELLYIPQPLYDHDATFVIAHLTLDLLGEINWPGTVEIGTAVEKVGNSSVHLIQTLFHKDQVVAKAKTVIVQIDVNTRKSKALSEHAKSIFRKYTLEKLV